MPLICRTAKGKYFSQGDWTTQISLNHLTKIAFWRTRFLAAEKARSIREVGKALGFSPSTIDRLAKSADSWYPEEALEAARAAGLGGPAKGSWLP